MPRCIILQPDGDYAIWSTVVDDFVYLGCTEAEVRKLDAEADTQLTNIEKSGIAYDWAKDWNRAIKTLMSTNPKSDSLSMINTMRLPLKMKPTKSLLQQANYWRTHWRIKCEMLEYKLRNR